MNILNKIAKERSDKIALSLCVFGTLLWSVILIHKYYVFGYNDWDLAFFSQAAWNLLHGSQFVPLFGVNFFGNHSNFFVFFTLPFYALWPHPLTLNLIKIILFFAGSFILYLIGKKKIGPGAGIFMMILYVLYIPNLYALAWEFDFEALSPFFLFLLFYLYEKGSWKAFILTAILTMTIKENMPLVIMAWGILGFIAKKNDRIRWGVIPFFLGLAVFLTLILWVIPFLKGTKEYGYIYNYRHLGSSYGQIISNLLLNPKILFQYLLQPERLNFLGEIFTPLVYLPLASPGIALICLPLILQHVLSSVPQEHTIFYHYISGIAPFIFLATIWAIPKINLNQKPRSFRSLGIIVLIVMSVFNFIAHKDVLKGELFLSSNYLTKPKWQMIRQIPKDEKVLATFSFLPELSTCQDLYSFHKIIERADDPAYIQSIINKLNYVLIDFNDTWLRTSVSTDRLYEIMRGFFLNNRWEVIQAAESVFLFKKSEKNSKDPPISIRPVDLAIQSQAPLIVINDEFELKNFTLQEERIGQDPLYHFTFQWQCLKKPTDSYAVVINLEDKGGSVLRHRPIGYNIHPTNQWKEGEVIVENYWFYPGHLKEGKYTFKILFKEWSKNRVAVLKDKESRPMDKNIFVLTDIEVKSNKKLSR